MAQSASQILSDIIRLSESLPTDIAEYATLTARQRRKIRAELEKVVAKLSQLGQSLNAVRQPAHIFDPTNPKVIGELVAKTLIVQEKEPLKVSAQAPFYGAGVYSVYYKGPFPAYSPISGKDHPIYVGKADPAELHALTPEAQGTRLYHRLKDHCRSISSAENLELADFECRYLVVRSAWVESAEDLLIDRFKPVWNNELKVCYGFGKHGDSAKTRQNERSPWDTIHPGRPWAKSEANKPNSRAVEEILAGIREHFKKHPTNG